MMSADVMGRKTSFRPSPLGVKALGMEKRERFWISGAGVVELFEEEDISELELFSPLLSAWGVSLDCDFVGLSVEGVLILGVEEVKLVLFS